MRVKRHRAYLRSRRPPRWPRRFLVAGTAVRAMGARPITDGCHVEPRACHMINSRRMTQHVDEFNARATHDCNYCMPVIVRCGRCPNLRGYQRRAPHTYMEHDSQNNRCARKQKQEYSASAYPTPSTIVQQDECAQRDRVIRDEHLPLWNGAFCHCS